MKLWAGCWIGTPAPSLPAGGSVALAGAGYRPRNDEGLREGVGGALAALRLAAPAAAAGQGRLGSKRQATGSIARRSCNCEGATDCRGATACHYRFRIDRCGAGRLLSSGRRFRSLNIVDDYSRECPGQLVDLSISGERLARFLNDLAKLRALPESLVIDNGPELTSKAIFEWAQANRVALHFSEPGKPTQNAFVASFNGRFRAESLNQEWFVNLAPARAISEAWRVHYHTRRPHSALGYQTPAA